MEKERLYKRVTCIANIVVVLSALMVIISMFMPYMQVGTGSVAVSLGNGWNFLMGKNGGRNGKIMAYLIIMLFFAAALIVCGVLRLMKVNLFNTKLLSLVYALIGLVTILISILLFVDFNSGAMTSLGIGIILNLIFSILAGLASVASAVTTSMVRL